MDYNFLLNLKKDRHQKLMEAAEHHRLVREAKKHTSKQQQVSTITDTNTSQTYLSRVYAQLYGDSYMLTSYDYMGYFHRW